MLNKTYMLYSCGAVRPAAARVADALHSMGYTVSVTERDGAACVSVRRDCGILDVFLGRRQSFRVDLSETAEGRLSFRISRSVPFDKLVCAVVGVFTVAVAWVFGLIAFSNQRNAERVADKTVSDFVTKYNSELRTADSQTEHAPGES